MPLLLEGLFCSIQESALAMSVVVVAEHVGAGAVTVQAKVAGVASALPAASVARTAKV